MASQVGNLLDSKMKLPRVELLWQVDGPIVPLVATLGILLIAKQMEVLGRKENLQITFLLYAAGWFSLSVAPNFLYLCVSLGILAFTMNLSKVVTALYKTEICSQRKTPVPTSSDYLLFTLGTTLDYLLNYFFMWRMTALIYGIVSVIGMIQSYIIPETPYWHLSRRHFVKAKHSLTWLHPSMKYEDLSYRIKAEEISIENDVYKEKSWASIFNDLTQMKYLKGFVLGVVLCALRSGCGRDILTIFNVNIFAILMCHSIKPETLSIGYGVFELAGCVLAQTRMCKFRRKTILYFSSSIIMISLALLIVCKHIPIPFVKNDSIPWIMVSSLYIYGMMVTSRYVYCLDLLACQIQFPSKKERMILILSSISYFFCFVYVKLFIAFEQAISLEIVFSYFFFNVLVSILVVYFFVPDTTNKEFKEIWN